MANCKKCDRELISKNPKTVYCSNKCKTAAYRERLNELKPPMANCKCGQELISKKSGAMYCSNKCKTAAYRERLDELKPPTICWFCGIEFKIKRHTKFCSEIHKMKFYKRKEMNKPISLVIDSKTRIETRKYDKIPEVIQQWKERMSIQNF